MTTLVRAALTVRRRARTAYGVGAAALFVALLLAGAFRTGPGGPGLLQLLAAGLWVAVVTTRATARDRTGGVDLEVGLLVLLGVHAVVQATGGLDGPLYPAVYGAVAFLAAFAQAPIGAVLVLAAVALDALLGWLADGPFDLRRFALHAGFLTLFGVLHLASTRVEIARVRQRSRRALDREREEARKSARLFRLSGAPSQGAGPPDPDTVFRSSLEEVHHALYYLLELLQRTLELHTCVLLLRTPQGDRLRIVELVTDSDDVAEGTLPIGTGAVGAVVRRGLATRLENLRPGYGGLSYYRGPAQVRSFLGMPVEEGGETVGALCADRTVERAFGAQDEAVLRGAASQILRILENERVFLQLEKSKREQGSLFRASQALGEALTEEQVIEAGLAAASEIAPHDLAAVTLYDPVEKRHRVRRAVGRGAERIADLAFKDNASLTAMAVRNRHYLPYRGELDPRQQVVFTRRAKLPDVRSLLILPLVVREDAIGTLMVAAEHPGAFPWELRPTLTVLANQLAVALANAAAVRRLEEMATTDGLTGCLNKRAFHEEMEAKLRAAQRFGRPLSLLVTDIDHFKSVNDTYGHATGDVVIKELGGLLMRVKRETDVVARFGGEEFCVLCEQTDGDGAYRLAERIRAELEQTTFRTELGPLGVTCSLGVATFPSDAETPEALFEITDQALYVAKRTGRNKVCTSRDVSAPAQPRG
ncbi:MAG: diguanylate cyclase [Sandaracinaceae bacterium]